MPSGNAPLTSYLSQGTISNYDPSWRDKAAYWLAQNWYGDNREGVQKANRLMNVADVTPVGIPLALDDAARSFGHGNYAGGAVTLAMAGIPAVRKEAKLTGKAAQDTLNSIMAKHGLAAPTKRFEYAPMYRPPGHETVPAGFVEFGPPSQKHKFGTVVYDKPLSIKDEDAFELVPLDPNHPKNLKKEYDQFHADFQDKFSAQNETFEAVNGKDRVIVTPSVRQDGWQVTKFDGDIPTGHSEHSDFDELAREMWSHYKSGFKPASEATTATNPVLSAILEKHGLTQPKTIRAYHGSPHSFDKFDMSKIGTGEGAQAYGHGLYFAENENVATGYRDALSDTSTFTTSSGKKIPSWVAKRVTGYDFIDNPSTDQINPNGIAEIRADFQQRLAESKREHAAGDWNAATRVSGQQEILDALDDIEKGAKVIKPGSMYEVQINADPDQFLDWDKPLSEQGEKVRGAVKYAFGNVPDNSKFGDYNLPTVPGPSQTRLLKDKGVAGIKYLDAGSRGKGDGSRNYVVFDERLIQILRKYGLLPAMLGGGAAFGSLSPQDQSQ